MQATIDLLGQQHQDVLTVLADAETRLATGDERIDLTEFITCLQGDVMAHFALEEQALFPILENHATLSNGPLAVIKAEHERFRMLLRQLDSAMRLTDIDGERARAAELIELLRAHIAKEDQVLFPMAKQLLNAEEQREVDVRAAQLQTSAAQKLV